MFVEQWCMGKRPRLCSIVSNSYDPDNRYLVVELMCVVSLIVRSPRCSNDKSDAAKPANCIAAARCKCDVLLIVNCCTTSRQIRKLRVLHVAAVGR